VTQRPMFTFYSVNEHMGYVYIYDIYAVKMSNTFDQFKNSIEIFLFCKCISKEITVLYIPVFTPYSKTKVVVILYCCTIYTM
jgi:hypothetical protein